MPRPGDGTGFEQFLLRGVVMGLKQERFAMEASVTELKGRVDQLDARVSALDRKMDAFELRLSVRLDLAKAEIISEMRRNSLDLRVGLGIGMAVAMSGPPVLRAV